MKTRLLVLLCLTMLLLTPLACDNPRARMDISGTIVDIDFPEALWPHWAAVEWDNGQVIPIDADDVSTKLKIGGYYELSLVIKPRSPTYWQVESLSRGK